MKVSFLAKMGCVLMLWALSPLQHADEPTQDVMESTLSPLSASGKPESKKQVQKRWQALLDDTLPLATAQVARIGSFVPFAALLATDGQIRIVSVDPLAQPVAPAAALATLRREVTQLARNYRPVAVIYFADAVVVRNDTGLRQTGVRLKLDHSSGTSMEGFIPYLRNDQGAVKLLTPEYRPSKNVTYP